MSFSRIQSITIDSSGNVSGGQTFPLVGVPGSISFNGDDTYSLTTPQIVPLQATPSQQFTITLNDQSCNIRLYTKQLFVPISTNIPTDPPLYQQETLLFLDLFVNDSLVIGGVLCQNQSLIVRNTYLGFEGDIAFFDMQGGDDPQYTGLGSRWILVYFPPFSVFPSIFA